MVNFLTPCRVRLTRGMELNRTNLQSMVGDGHDHATLVELQAAWTKDIVSKFVHDANSTNLRPHIRKWDLVLSRDGTVENIATDDNNTSFLDEHVTEILYPAEYQCPSSKVAHISSDTERVSRCELFAIGSLLYQVNTLHKPFHDIHTDNPLDSADSVEKASHTDDVTAQTKEEEIEARFTEGRVPDDIWGLPNKPLMTILCCWCPQLMQVLRRRATGSITKRMIKGVQEHPGRTALQVLGAVTTVASIVTIPVLGAVGFSALGPVAGSAAAAWQASLGIVKAGSVFAWCQSAAMGGAAVGGIIVAGASGGAILVGASLLALLDDEEFDKLDLREDELRELFRQAWLEPV